MVDQIVFGSITNSSESLWNCIMNDDDERIVSMTVTNPSGSVINGEIIIIIIMIVREWL